MDVISGDLNSSQTEYTTNRRLQDQVTKQRAIQKLLNSPQYNNYKREFHDAATERAANYFGFKQGSFNVSLPNKKLDLRKIENISYNPARPHYDGYNKQTSFLNRLIKHKDSEKILHNA